MPDPAAKASAPRGELGIRKRPTGRARQARYRLRQARGDLSVTIDVTRWHVAKLVLLGYLRDDMLEDRHAVARAIDILISNIIIDDGDA